jgi:hypothetical protein
MSDFVDMTHNMTELYQLWTVESTTVSFDKWPLCAFRAHLYEYFEIFVNGIVKFILPTPFIINFGLVHSPRLVVPGQPRGGWMLTTGPSYTRPETREIV